MTRVRFVVLAAACQLAATTLVHAQGVTIQDVSAASENVVDAIQGTGVNGHVMFVWKSGASPTPVVYRTAHYDPASDTVSSPITLTATSAASYDLRGLVVGPTGDATVFGFSFVGVGSTARTEIVAARYTAGSGQWSPFATLMPSALSGAEVAPSIPAGVADAMGNVTIVWYQATCKDCSTYELYAARYDVSGGWSTRVVAGTVWHSFLPSIAVDGAGNVIATAARVNAAAGPTLLAVRYTSSSGTWSVVTGPTVDAFVDFRRQSTIAVTPDGRALLGWQESFGLALVPFNVVTEAWGTLKRTAGSNAGAPRIAADRSGNYVVVWAQFFASTLPWLKSRSYAWTTDTWGDEVTISTLNVGSGRVVIDDAGVPTAMWVESLDPVNLELARYDTVTGSWRSPVTVLSVSKYGSIGLLGLSADGAGGLRASWMQRPDQSSVMRVQTSRLTPGSAVPGAPQGLRASVNGNTVTLTWNAPTNGVAATGYTLVGRLAAGAPVLATLPMGAGTSFSFSAPNGSFVLSVTASNASGTGPESAPLTVTVPQTVAAPGAPSNLAAVVSGATVSFTWTPPSSGGAVGNYVLQAGTTPGFSTPLASIPLGASPSFAVPGVPAGTYYVRVLAQNSGGTGAASNEVSFTVAGLAPPGAPTLQTPVVSGATVTLSWNPGAGGAPSSYTLIARATPGGAPLATVPLSGISVSFSGVPSGTYYLALTASNAAGTSPPSTAVTLVVP